MFYSIVSVTGKFIHGFYHFWMCADVQLIKSFVFRYSSAQIWRRVSLMR